MKNLSLAIFSALLLTACGGGGGGGSSDSSDVSNSSSAAFMVADLTNSAADSSPLALQNLNGTLVFGARDPQLTEQLWAITPPERNPVNLTNFPANPGGPSLSSVRAVEVSGNQAFFTNNDDLWVSDGTPSGTIQLTFGSPLVSSLNLLGTTNRLHFNAMEASTGTEPWISDGSTTTILADIVPGSSSSNPSAYTVLNSQVIFEANNQLWSTDGSSIANLNSPVSIDQCCFVSPSRGIAYFTSINGSGGIDLWVTNGTATGHQRITSLTNSVGGIATWFRDVNGTMFFSAPTPANGNELWFSDGSSAGFIDIIPGANGSGPEELVNLDGTLVFAAQNPAAGRELWRSNGTIGSTVMIRDINPGPDDSFPDHLTAIDGLVYMDVRLPGEGEELWVTDGTESGTRLLSNIRPGPLDSETREFTEVGDFVYFSAETTENGNELWAIRKP